jgi:hypothetical protein
MSRDIFNIDGHPYLGVRCKRYIGVLSDSDNEFLYKEIERGIIERVNVSLTLFAICRRLRYRAGVTLQLKIIFSMFVDSYILRFEIGF